MHLLSLKQMRYFDALARLLHFGKAAEAVNVSQPALSAQIADMEAKLGYRLFERRRGRISMTSQALAIQPRIERILAEVKDLEDMAAAKRGVLEGRFRLGIIPTVAPYLLPEILPELRQTYRGLELELKEAVTEALMAELEGGRIDAAILALPVHAPRIETRTLFEDPFFLAASADDKNFIVGPVTPEGIDPGRLLLLDEGHCLRDQALQLCGDIRPKTLANYGATSLTTILQMVGHGMGVTLIPEIALEAESRHPAIRILPFAEPVPARRIGLAFRRGSEREADFSALAEIVRRNRPRPKRPRHRTVSQAA
jgi:LysR family transcriptional regulator, hydrogen peroxide-inducible genes activator